MSMTKDAVKNKMKESNVMVLNVLPHNDYAKLHIEGSESLPLGLSSDDFVQAVEKKYGRDKFFITYCAGMTCHAGPDAAKALQKKGFKANDYPGECRNGRKRVIRSREPKRRITGRPRLFQRLESRFVGERVPRDGGFWRHLLKKSVHQGKRKYVFEY